MRMIAGLDEPTAARVKVNGRDYRAVPAPIAELGILLEDKGMHTGRPARNHLPCFGARPRQRVRSLV
jgi:ABC-2 type transport system ATP-binding protein